VEYLEEVADALISCNFGVVFFGMGLTQTAGKFRNIEVAISLIRDLNNAQNLRSCPCEVTLTSLGQMLYQLGKADTLMLLIFRWAIPVITLVRRHV